MLERALEIIAQEKKEKTGRLDLSVLKLEKLPAVISELVWLEALYLNYNQISDISFLKDLTNLNALDISYNQISDINF